LVDTGLRAVHAAVVARLVVVGRPHRHEDDLLRIVLILVVPRLERVRDRGLFKAGIVVAAAFIVEGQLLQAIEIIEKGFKMR